MFPGTISLFFPWNQGRKQKRFVRIFGLWTTIKTLNSVQTFFEIIGNLDDSTSIYNFEEEIKPALHSGIQNKQAAFIYLSN